MLLGAPAGLVWAAVTPRVQVQASAGDLRPLDPTAPAFIAGEAAFAAVVLGAGALTGLLVLLLGRRYGVGPILGLAAGGLLAAEIARRVGPLVGVEETRALLQAGRDGTYELPGRVRARSAVTLWPLAALVVVGIGTALRARDEPAEPVPEPAEPLPEAVDLAGRPGWPVSRASRPLPRQDRR